MAEDKQEVKVEAGKFNDNVDTYLKEVINLMSYIRQERAQLYGSLGILMRQAGVSKFHISPEEVFETMQHYSVHFIPAEDGLSGDVELHFHEEIKNDKKNEILH